MDDLRSLSTQELQDRNVSLTQQRDVIKQAQRALTAEMDRRAGIDRNARLIATLPDELRATSLIGAEPELSERVTAILIENAVGAPAQTIEPVGVPSEEAVGNDPFDDEAWEPAGTGRWFGFKR